MQNYWIKSGMPTLLEQQLKRFQVNLQMPKTTLNHSLPTAAKW